MQTQKSLKDLKNSTERIKLLNQDLNFIPNSTLNENIVSGKNIENFIGAIQIPLGIAGPLKIKDLKKEYFIPLATTEGALVASISRGCKAASLSGGVTTEVEFIGMTRGPVFKTEGIVHSKKTIDWIDKNFLKLKAIAEKTSNHLALIKIDHSIIGKNLYLRFYFDTQDAMGMNMATFATEKAAEVISQKTGVELISLAGNFDVDKKPSFLNSLLGRGRKVWAEVTIPKYLVKEVLKTTPEKIADTVSRKCLIGSAASGSVSFNSHFANVIAAIFIATGQDLAHVVEGSLGITTAEVLDNGDLYFSVYLPSLLIGTVGGGTSLPTQQEAFSILKLEGSKKTVEFARVIAASVLAGELSLISSLSEGSLAKAHKKLGRKK